MDLILWRHAEAADGLPDASRPLTPKGERQAEQIARWLRSRLPKNPRIIVSPARRTQQTAQALGVKFETADAVGTKASPAGILRAANWPAGDHDVLIIGHQPTLGQAAALLLTDKPGEMNIKKGALWWFSNRTKGGENTLVLRAVIGPDLVD